TVVYRAWLDGAMPPDTPEAAADTALATPYGGVATAESLSSDGHTLLEAVHHSVTLGLQTYAALGAVLIGLAATLITVVLVIRKDDQGPTAEDQYEEPAERQSTHPRGR